MRSLAGEIDELFIIFLLELRDQILFVGTEWEKQFQVIYGKLNWIELSILGLFSLNSIFYLN